MKPEKWFFWEDELAVIEPEPILPEKVVLRDGWTDDDFFVLMNLWGDRNMPNSHVTAHRYPALNELLALVYGEQFVVPNNNQTSRDRAITCFLISATNSGRLHWLTSYPKSFGLLQTIRVWDRQFGMFLYWKW